MARADSPAAEPIRPATEPEERAMRERFGTILTVTNQSQLPMHFADGDGRPICEARYDEPRDIEYRDHDVACYPVGYKEVCRYCVKWWRENVGSGR